MNRRVLTAIALLASVVTGASAQQIPFGPPTVTPPYDSIVLTEPVAGSDIPVDIMFLQLDPKVFDVEEPQLQTMDLVVPHVNKNLALERLRRIKVPLLFMNRDHDHMQGLFETAYRWAQEAGLDPEHVSYDHDVHGYVLRVKRDASGAYQPDAIQLKAIDQALDFFRRRMAQ